MKDKIRETAEQYRFRIKVRLDGGYLVVLSQDRPAYVLSRDKKGEIHLYAKGQAWDFKMLHEVGIQNYLNSLLECLKGYSSEVQKLEISKELFENAFRGV